MGFMVYDSSTQISFDDRVLAHLEVVIVSKLRRKESFALSWRESPDNGDGRTTIWIDPSIPLRFRYSGSRPPALDRDWMERLAAAAASSSGLIAVDEDGQQVVGSTREHGL
ncbi:ATP-dependent DNA ligase [Leifsonia sp. NPDC077715]|uniref:DUF7882 family protein n=1 Tax=Leifsonia sp. NPDC077715 TaxID=3155539 RepID=UPI00341BCFAC